MKCNIGPTDRVFRVVVGVMLFSLGFVVSGTLGVFVSIFGLIPLLTGVIGYCPVYTFLNINGCGPKTPKAL